MEKKIAFHDGYNDYMLASEPYISRAMSYSFQFKPNGWAIWTINDNTGEVTLQSDWGTYTYRWHVDSIGERNMHDFIVGVDVHYIADKFSYTNKYDLGNVVDIEETLQYLEESIKELGIPDSEIQNDLIARAKIWTRSARCEEASGNEEEYEPLQEALSGFPHAYMQYCKSPRYVLLTTCLIPHFQAFLKERKSADAVVPS